MQHYEKRVSPTYVIIIFSCFSLEKPLTVSWLRDNIIIFTVFHIPENELFLILIFSHYLFIFHCHLCSLALYFSAHLNSLCIFLFQPFVLYFIFTLCSATFFHSLGYLYLLQNAQGFANEMISQLHVIEPNSVELNRSKSSQTQTDRTEAYQLIDVRNIVIEEFFLCVSFHIYFIFSSTLNT